MVTIDDLWMVPSLWALVSESSLEMEVTHPGPPANTLTNLVETPPLAVSIRPFQALSSANIAD